MWTLESVTVDGAVQAIGQRRHIKIITASHYAWASQEPGASELRSAADSLAAYRTSGFGAGTYRGTDSTYTERLDIFYHPAYIGREVTISCRHEAKRWQHAFEWPVLENGRVVRRIQIVEVFRKVE